MNLRKFFKELGKRNVIKETVAYLIIAWVIIQVASILLPVFDAPSWILKSLTVFLIVCIPIVVIFSWLYQITDKGLKKTVDIEATSNYNTAKSKINVVLIVASVIAITFFIFIGAKFKSLDESQPYSVAILPFKNINLNEENESFIFGIREDIWQRLARIKGINIRSNRSAEAKQTTDKANKEIAGLLNCKYLVDGTVTQYGDRIELNISIWDDQDNLIWQNLYDNAFKELFKLQKELSRSIVDAIKFNLSSQEKRKLEYTGTLNLDAFLRVKEGEKKVADNNEIEGIFDFKEAIKHDSMYADAYGNLAYAYSILCWKYTDNHLSDLENLKFYTKKALDLDPNNGRALLALAAFNDVVANNKTLAAEYYNKAAESIPNDPLLYFELGAFNYFSIPQNIEKAIEYDLKALDIEPLQWQYSRSAMNSLAKGGRHQEALNILEKTAYLFPPERFPNPIKFWTAELARYKDNNRNAKLQFLLDHMKIDDQNPFWPTEIGIHYDCYMNDDKNFLKYAKHAYELDTDLTDHYINALLDNYEYEEAKSIIESDAFRSLPEKKRISVYNNYFSAIGDFNALKKLIDTSYLAKDSINYIWHQVKSGQIKDLNDNGFKNYNQLSVAGKATIYAILEHRDSMYYYLNLPIIEAFLKREPSEDPYLTIHSSHYFDPYRNDPEYKEFMKSYFLE